MVLEEEVSAEGFSNGVDEDRICSNDILAVLDSVGYKCQNHCSTERL